MFPETDFDRELEAMLLDAPAPGRYAARSAIRHLNAAALIATVDPEMAAFRAITAEEEAATAVFHALRRHGYVGSSRLNPHDHLQKNAVTPFCQAVSTLFAWADAQLELKPQLIITSEGAKRLALRFHVGRLGLGDRFALPQPPLNFAVSTIPGALHDFSEQLNTLAEGVGATNMSAHLKRRANFRNEILYASTSGMPSVSLGDFLQVQRMHVKVLIGLFLLIDPYPTHQLFVSQCLLSFLKMLNRLPADITF